MALQLLQLDPSVLDFITSQVLHCCFWVLKSTNLRCILHYEILFVLSVSVRHKTIKLRVGELISRVKVPTVPWPSTRETIYIGGISGKVFLKITICVHFSKFQSMFQLRVHLFHCECREQPQRSGGANVLRGLPTKCTAQPCSCVIWRDDECVRAHKYQWMSGRIVSG